MSSNKLNEAESANQLPEQIAKLKKEFRQLKSTCSQPRIYLADYFASLINRVDITAETFLLNQTDQTNDLSKQARIDQSKIVETINERKTELFASQLEEDPELLEKIKDIGLRLEAQISTVDVPGIGLKIPETRIGLQRKNFLGVGTLG